MKTIIAIVEAENSKDAAIDVASRRWNTDTRQLIRDTIDVVALSNKTMVFRAYWDKQDDLTLEAYVQDYDVTLGLYHVIIMY